MGRKEGRKAFKAAATLRRIRCFVIKTDPRTIPPIRRLRQLQPQAQDGHNPVRQSPQSWQKRKACDRGHCWERYHLLLLLSALVPTLPSIHSGAQGILRGSGGGRDNLCVLRPLSGGHGGLHEGVARGLV